MTTIVGLVLVGDSGFVELQLILNSLTGENLKRFSFFSFIFLLQGIGAPLVDQSIRASVKELPISGIRHTIYFLMCKKLSELRRA